MQVQGHQNVWAIGDAAAVPDPARKGHACPPTCQHSLRQGKRVARNVAAALGNGRKRPFRYRTLGVFVDMGRHQAVASTLGIKWRGFPAWFLARTYHLALMPGTSRRAARDGLDDGPAVRARLGRTGSARPSARPGSAERGRDRLVRGRRR